MKIGDVKIGDEIEIVLKGVVERIEGGYADNKTRYLVRGFKPSCYANVTNEEIVHYPMGGA